MLIAVLVGVMIFIVIGVNLIPMIADTIEETTKDSEDVPEAVSALLEILPIVFVAVVIISAVAWIGGSGFSFSSKSKSKDYDFGSGRMSGRDLLEKIKREEEKEEEETEVLETPGTLEVPGVPKVPPSSSKPSKRPPWAK